MEEQTIISPGTDALAAEHTQIAIAPGAEVTQAAVVIECPVCHTANPPGDRWCQDCGFLLSSQAPETLEMPPAAGARLLMDGREFELHPGANSIGRVAADVLLPDPTVSRHHATLTIGDEGASVEDAGSTNGTSVNGSSLPAGSRRSIRDGDTLKLGNVMVKLHWPDMPASALAAATGEAAVGSEAGGAGEAGPRIATLIAAEGVELALAAGVTTVGRRAENLIALSADPYMSGRHAEIRCDHDGCVLVDIGSTNGSFLRRASGGDEERLRPRDPQPLSSGDEIRLGQSTFTFQVAERAAETEPPEGDLPLQAGTDEAAFTPEELSSEDPAQ
jgi:pSer/pThr/pTyr-binding forkhead associated (FHA) protein